MNARTRQTFVRDVAKSGNSAMVRIHAEELRALGVSVGSQVKVTLEPVDAAYDESRAAAERATVRWSHTLRLFGQ